MYRIFNFPVTRTQSSFLIPNSCMFPATFARARHWKSDGMSPALLGQRSVKSQSCPPVLVSWLYTGFDPTMFPATVMWGVWSNEMGIPPWEGGAT